MLLKRSLLTGLALALIWLPRSGFADAAKPVPALSAAQIVEKNAAARGGLAAWRATKNMVMSGQLDAGGKHNVQLPFTMKLARPHKSRFELKFNGETALQVYDGTSGWKLRPYLGRSLAEPFTEAELKKAAVAQDLDGYLIDYKAKGSSILLEAIEKVENNDAYKLRVTLKGGEVRHIWVDAHSFLEVKIEGNPRVIDNKPRNVAIYMRDYRPEHGLMVPHVLETMVDRVKQTRKMSIQSVAFDQPLDDAQFAKPAAHASAGLRVAPAEQAHKVSAN